MATRKRGNNEGTISLRSDGRWEARVSLGYKGGKQVRKCFYGKTRQEVASKLSTAIADFKRGAILPNEKLTTQTFLESWLEGTARLKLRESTFSRYRTLVQLHILPTLGTCPLTKLTPAAVQALWSHMLDKGLQPRTVIQARAVLRSALNDALRQSLVTRNAAALSTPPKLTPHKPIFLNAEQAEQMLRAFQGHPLEALVTLALTTGLRVGEMLGLTWGDIDFEAKELRVGRQQQRVGKQIIVSEPKTKRSARSVALSRQAVEALKRHRDRQIVLLQSGIEVNKVVTGRVFTNEKGGHLENGTVLRQFQKECARFGLPRMRLHDLRHSCATLLLSRGIHPRVVMELLGHSTIAMTMNVYSHVVPDLARGAADAMESIFDKRPAQRPG